MPETDDLEFTQKPANYTPTRVNPVAEVYADIRNEDAEFTTPPPWWGGKPGKANAAPPQEQGFVGRVWKDWGQRANKVSEIMTPEKGETSHQSLGMGNVASRGYNFTGQVAGGMADVIGEAGKSLYKTFVPQIIQDNVKKGFEASAKVWMEDPLGRVGIAALQKGVKDWELFKKTHPKMAMTIESTINIGSVLWGGGKIGEGGAVIKEGAAEAGAGKVFGKAADFTEAALAKQKHEQALKIIKPDPQMMSGTEWKEAAARNKFEKKGIFRRPEVKTTAYHEELASTVEDVVDIHNKPLDNINNIYGKIKVAAEQTKALPEKYNRMFNQRQLQDVLNEAKEESELIFAKNKQREWDYDAVVNKFMQIMSTKKKNLSSVLEARKEFDIFMEKKFPGIFDKDAGDNVRRNAIMDVRYAANKFIEDSLPEGEKFKALLRQQNNMYNASKMIVNNMPHIDRSLGMKIVGLAQRHPWIAAEVLAGSLGRGVMSHLGLGGSLLATALNPGVIIGLTVYGTAKIGNRVITAKAMKNGLSHILRYAEKELTASEKKQIQATVEALEKAPVAKDIAGSAATGGYIKENND